MMRLSTRFRKFACNTPALSLMPDLSEFTSVQDAADELGFNVISLRVLLRRGKLKGTKLGRTWLVSKESVREYKAKTAGLSKNDPRRGKQN